MKRWTFELLVYALLVLGTGAARADGVIVYPPDSNPGGKSYGEWGAAWWQWVFSLPVTDAEGNVVHPAFTQGNVDLSLGQAGNVWFLSGGFFPAPVNRSGTVPPATALFFPIHNAWADNLDVPPTHRTVGELRSLIAGWVDVGQTGNQFHASVDGVALEQLETYRAASPDTFSYKLPEPGIGLNVIQYLWPFDPYNKIVGWVYPDPADPTNPDKVTFSTDPISGVVSDGYWIMLAPLPPGDHTITFGVRSASGETIIDTTYNLNVVPEPSSIALIGIGAVGLIAYGWQRRRRRIP